MKVFQTVAIAQGDYMLGFNESTIEIPDKARIEEHTLKMAKSIMSDTDLEGFTIRTCWFLEGSDPEMEEATQEYIETYDRSILE